LTLKVILDANVIISSVIAPKGAPARILNAWRAEYIDVVTCPALLSEIAEKLRLPRIRRKYPVSDDVVFQLLVRLAQAAILVSDTSNELLQLVGLPDPDDAFLFAAAVNSNADFIVTGDKALLRFGWRGPGRIVSPRQFWDSDFPDNLELTLVYPLFILENLAAEGFLTVESQGRQCAALFTNGAQADEYVRKETLLSQLKELRSPAALADHLERIANAGCKWVAFNPIEECCMLQPISLTINALRRDRSAGANDK
jgi:uncharacterized protein